jgi:hypothetical protein
MYEMAKANIMNNLRIESSPDELTDGRAVRIAPRRAAGHIGAGNAGGGQERNGERQDHKKLAHGEISFRFFSIFSNFTYY